MLGQNFRSQLIRGLEFGHNPTGKSLWENESVCLNSLPQILKDNGYKIVWFFHNSGTYDYLGFDLFPAWERMSPTVTQKVCPFRFLLTSVLSIGGKLRFVRQNSQSTTRQSGTKTRALTIYCEDQIRSEENEGELARKLVIRPNNHQLDIETIAERNARQALMLVS